MTIDSSDFSFSHLGPDLILDAIESLGVRIDSGLLALNSYENRVYQFKLEDGKRYVAKFYRPSRWEERQIIEEHDFALELQEAELPVVAPLLFDGKSLHHYDAYSFALFPSVGGRQFEVDNLDQIEWMGRLIGRIHKLASTRNFAHRPQISTSAFLNAPRQRLADSKILPSHLHTPFMVILDQVIEVSSRYYSTDYKQIRLHGDCHPGNILWQDGPIFVDLDDCRQGPAIQDLWMMLNGDRQQQLMQLDTLIEAYDEFHHFDPRELQLIEALRAMRMVHYMAWLDMRWQDPAFPAAFPWFGEDKYWENQILALKEQLSCLQEPAISLLPY
ncbi:serine/threonine protein kinase [Agaribacter flavus]|uniref:Stress response kinase A n=1 Tax=Agaribacter flavus TaxID=1902781 RepID=A0ABV7FPC2_9ALTE